MEDRLRITLKAARVNAGLSRKEVAGKMGITINQLATWERGSVKVRAEDFIKLCQLYQVDPKDIVLVTSDRVNG